MLNDNKITTDDNIKKVEIEHQGINIAISWNNKLCSFQIEKNISSNLEINEIIGTTKYEFLTIDKVIDYLLAKQIYIDPKDFEALIDYRTTVQECETISIVSNETGIFLLDNKNELVRINTLVSNKNLSLAINTHSSKLSVAKTIAELLLSKYKPDLIESFSYSFATEVLDKNPNHFKLNINSITDWFYCNSELEP